MQIAMHRVWGGARREPNLPRQYSISARREERGWYVAWFRFGTRRWLLIVTTDEKRREWFLEHALRCGICPCAFCAKVRGEGVAC